jgi:hypothetical protein
MPHPRPLVTMALRCLAKQGSLPLVVPCFTIIVGFTPLRPTVKGQPAVGEKAFVSFVVIAHNEAANIARTLTAITSLENLPEHEIIVVDDGSRDNTARIVEGIAEKNACVRLIEIVKNRGRGYARNEGIMAAHGELIATIDADIVVPPDWFERARAALGDHDAVGGTAVPDGDVQHIYKRFGLAPRFVGHTNAVTGSNALYRREVFDVATFDPALREGEDSALNHAMARQGLSVATVPGLFVRHEENKTLATSLRWLFDVGRGATRQLFTYHEVRQPDLAAGAFVASAALGALAATRGHRLLGVAAPVGFVVAASTQHVRTRFETPVAHWPKIVPAIAVDSAVLTAYFAGRIAGLAALRRKL